MKLIIFCLNCWLLPPPFSLQNMVRLREIIALIKKLKPDVICLQEVWLQYYVSVLKAALPEYQFISSSSPTFNVSGLVTGTRMRISVSQYQFPKTKEYSLIEKYGGKGYHTVTLGQLLLINTHLYAATNTFEQSISVYQFKLLAELFRKQRGILIGDLNLEQEKIKTAQSVFNYSATTCTLSATNRYANMGFNKTSVNKTIDYMLPTLDVSVETQIMPEEFSDHYCIIGSITN
jgi:endonuclease/exonuclease/phosphatase family metal-dependent hydrolase